MISSAFFPILVLLHRFVVASLVDIFPLSFSATNAFTHPVSDFSWSLPPFMFRDACQAPQFIEAADRVSPQGKQLCNKCGEKRDRHDSGRLYVGPNPPAVHFPTSKAALCSLIPGYNTCPPCCITRCSLVQVQKLGVVQCCLGHLQDVIESRKRHAGAPPRRAREIACMGFRFPI